MRGGSPRFLFGTRQSYYSRRATVTPALVADSWPGFLAYFIAEIVAMIAEGTTAPDFTLPDQEAKEVTLSALRGQPVVLYFYPKDDTPGCTTEACAFRDARADYEAAGAKVIGVSPDDVKSHAKFIKKYDLNFSLLADLGAKVCSDYGVWKEKSMFGKSFIGVERTTFLIDRDGVVRKVFPKVKVDGHATAVLDAIKAL
jgi:thioredoxin-dependent peroxiredoxin